MEYIYGMVAILGIVMVVLGRYFVFGYLDLDPQYLGFGKGVSAFHTARSSAHVFFAQQKAEPLRAAQKYDISIRILQYGI